jgi:hypothetical protein
MSNLPIQTVALFVAWLAIPVHKQNPYPTYVETEQLAPEAGIDVNSSPA